MATFKVKRHDTWPPITATLRDGEGDPVDLSGASVLFIAQARGESVTKIRAAMTGPDGAALGASGQVEYRLTASDNDVATTYRLEYEVTFADGRKQTFPTSGWDTLIVFEDLDDQ